MTAHRPPLYAPLWCKSSFSFLEGASQPDELVAQAHALGLQTIALTDRDGLYGVVQAHVKAKELGIKLIIGAEIGVGEGRTRETIILLARDRAGYANLSRLISRGRLRVPKGDCLLHWTDVFDHAAGLTALCPVPLPLTVTAPLVTAFGPRLYAAVSRQLEPEDRVREKTLRDWAATAGIPTVAATRVLYHDPSRQPLQDIFTCLRHHTTLARAGRLLEPNAEHFLRAPHDMARLFPDCPDDLARTLDIADACTFSLDDIRYRYPAERLPDGTSTRDWLRHLTFEGAAGRYREGIPADVTAQLDKELKLIGQLDYEGYFLTMHEIVQYCRANDILCQGRGSAANSAVCYCLGITAIDPVRMGLLFERFLSLERAEPPDIDLDIQHGRREEVIQHVYERYGRAKAAMVANVIRYRTRSALREVGKVLGFTESELAPLATLAGSPGGLDRDLVAATGLALESPRVKKLFALVEMIQDFPRHLSIHPGGFLLGHEPVHDLVPIENGTMEGRTVIQWDKNDIEAIGLFKVDLLGLGALTLVDQCLRLLKQHRDVELTMATIPAEDPATYAMVQKADTVGTFQIESRAQMSMLPRLKPRTFYDLVIEVAIVRPGPISGGMVHPYLRRRNGEEAIDYPHHLLQPVLEKTCGVPLFQEQVMRIAIIAADYTPGEADQLRRDMAAWRRTGRMDKHYERLMTRMTAKGIAPDFALRLFEQIKGFGEYGFPESHAASFALICYVTCWLKCHYPTEFVCAILNAQPMGFYSPATLIENAKRHDVAFRPVDVGSSEIDCMLEDGTVRMGLRYIKGLRAECAARIVIERDTAPFASLEDFIKRVRPDRGSLSVLAEAGAFDSLGVDRRRALWEGAGLLATLHDSLDLRGAERTLTFRPLDTFEAITWDFQTGSHSTRGHPLAPLRPLLLKRGLQTATVTNQRPHESRTEFAGLVICRQRPGTASGVVFMTLEDETGVVNVIVWPKVYEKYRTVVLTESLVGVTGHLQNEQGVVHLIADRLWPVQLSYNGYRPVTVESHNFY